ncbi:MAG: site-specific integrase [Candidatus Bathyarchaeia archaeon]
MLSKKTIKPATIKRKVKTIKSMLRHGVDLSNPEAVIRFLNEVNWASGTKDIAVNSYRDYLNMLGLTEVKLPHIRREEKLPFIPLEGELEALISGVNARLGVFLRLLKETAIRPIEAWRLKWLDVDVANKCVTVTPAKYGLPRKLRISEQTLNMLLALPRNNAYVFSPSGNPERFSEELEHFTRNYQKQRKRLALKLQNPRLNAISLRTFRHWKATMEYVKTKDPVHVKEFLGHVNIKNTLRYIHLANAISEANEEYVCKTAKTIEEAFKLIEQGFEYVCEIEGTKLFRKRR